MNEQNDPLNESFENVPTAFPLLADGPYDLLVKEATLVKTNAGDPMLKLQFATTVPATSRTGEQLSPGATVFHNVTLVPSGNATIEMVMRNLGAVIQSAGLTSAEMGPGPWTQQLERLKTGQWHQAFQGRVLRCTVGFEKAGTSKSGKAFNAKNVIEAFVKK